MKRIYASMWVFVCLFAVTARAQDAASAPAVKNMVFDIKIIDIDMQTPEVIEAITKDPNRLNQMLSIGKAKLIAGTQLHSLLNQRSFMRTGQRVPVQTATLPAYQPPRISNANNQASQQSSEGPQFTVGIPQIAYENTGLTLEFEPRMQRDGSINLNYKIETTIINSDTGRLTPTFITRNLASSIMINQNQPPIILEMFQNEFPALSSAQTNPVNTMRGTFFILLSAKIVD